MFSTWVQNHLPKESCTNSWTFRDFLGRNKNFLGRKRNIVLLNLKNFPWNRTNDVLFLLKQAVDFYKQAQITRKRTKYLKNVPKITIFKLSENRIIPFNFFWIRIWALNGEIETVKNSITQNWKLYFQLRVAHLSLPKARIKPRIFLLRSVLH